MTLIVRPHGSHLEFNDHQRNLFCVFSGDGVNRLRRYLNDDLLERFDSGRTMYRDHDDDDLDEQTVAGLMHATGLGPDDDDMDDEGFLGEGSQYGGEVEGEPDR